MLTWRSVHGSLGAVLGLGEGGSTPWSSQRRRSYVEWWPCAWCEAVCMSPLGSLRVSWFSHGSSRGLDHGWGWTWGRFCRRGSGQVWLEVEGRRAQGCGSRVRGGGGG
ncbi:hypothetical protein F511_35188 [Dorcoceras hygrometricum]|uniref:Uncharacterized protein n=1 Tax=Dorcoceras hygrometricum TaxID=472368 RepID=A0A2Z7AVA2_9LAMI|nr:hypothetical protein F511_35188 [Dorcoceras hygrometricum]